KVGITFDQSIYIRQAIESLWHEAMQGSALAFIVILIFLRSLTSTLIISVAIPLSILLSFIVMYFLGQTLNVFTLGGLALAVGRLVDDSIVELENINRHLAMPGKERRRAVLDAAREVAMPIFSATITTIIVFVASLFLVLAPRVGLKPLIGTEFFPPSDKAQFRINVKAPIGTRIEETERIVKGMESIVRAAVRPEELKTLVTNVGIPQGRSAVFTGNTGPHSATVQVYLTTADKRQRSDREIVNAIRPAFVAQFPGTRYQFVAGGLYSG